MAKFDSTKSVFLITDTGAAERTLTTYITAIDGLPGPRELLDSTVLGDNGHTFHPSLENSSITIEGIGNNDSNGPDDVFGALRTHTAATNFKYGPFGGAMGDIQYSGDQWVRNYQLTTRVGSLVGFRAELQVEGTVTRGTFS